MITAILFLLPYFIFPTSGFAIAPLHVCSKSNTLICAVKPSFVPEYRVEEEGDGQDETTVEELIVANDIPAKQPVSKSNADSNNVKPMFAAMEPGTVVQIQVGDISLARKAWKKRRRSGSPLLVPCSVLKVDRQSTVRWNLIYLLEKFGSKHAAGTRISLVELTRRHRKHLQSSLTHQATVMGHKTAGDLVQALFHKQVQESYGVKLNVEDDMLWLEAPISKFRAQKRANGAAVLQFEDDMEDTLRHTGMVRNRRLDETGDANSNNSTAYRLQPLSAALRINQDDVDSGAIKNESFHAAVVFDYDKEGDAGSPLLTLSLNPSRNQVRERLKIVDRSQQLIQNPKHLLHTLSVGQGPLRGKVVRFFKGGAIIDCGVGRKVNSKGSAHQVVRVEGILRFKEAIVSDSSTSIFEGRQLDDDEDDSEDEEDEEWDDRLTIENLDGMDEDENDEGDAYDDDSEDYDGASAELSKVLKQLKEDEDFGDSEDITHLFETRADGSIVYHDPESGDDTVIPVSDEDVDEEDDDTAFKVNKRSIQRTKRSVQKIWPIASGLRRSVRLYIGDEIDVYVKSISKQSSQLLLTMDSSIQGRNAKDLKDEDKVQKKLTRLAKQLGGLHKIDTLRGQEHSGVVKATSNAGDWLYVQPDVEGLPVGVASVSTDHELHEGDKVRIRIEGVDENRGQLAMLILNKI
jgi:hypothetical protein